MFTRSISVVASLAIALGLAACHSNHEARNLDRLDNELTSSNAADPALTGALNDQIMVDPTLTQHSNAAAIRPPAQPYSAAVPPEGTSSSQTADIGKLAHAPAPKPGEDCPACSARGGALTLGELASRQGTPGTSSCAANVHYSAQWATRLGDLPIFLGAHVSEAAGADGNGCALRIVSFTTAAPADRVIDYYYTQATKSGYSADQQTNGRERVLGGTRSRDNGAYVLFVNHGSGGGSSVDLVINNGH
jgi:hypothetical protein